MAATGSGPKHSTSSVGEGIDPPLPEASSTGAGTAEYNAANGARADAPGEPVARRQIQRYVVHRVLGGGSFGSVYLCHDPRLDRLVAVKVIDETKLSGRSPDEYLVEAKLVAQLDHPSIVPVYDADRAEDGKPFVVSKYVAGGDLKAGLAARQWSFVQSAAAVAELADALAHAHRHGIVHRDVKPANILLDESGRVFLADFGIALHEANSSDPVAAGTVPYMSPEQACGEGHRLDGRSDIFSLGAVLYEMLRGKRLFVGKNRWELVARIISFDPDDLGEPGSWLPIALDRLLRKALAPRVMDRYNNAAAFAKDLRAWIAAENAADDGSASRLGLESTGPAWPGAVAAIAAGKSPVLQPRGLRPFQAADADVFLELLPGIRDADGLPEALRFWLDRLDPDRVAADAEPLPVGVIYGPSGGGKSSLAAAGVVPRLSRHVRVLSIECTPDDTAPRIARALGRMLDATDPSSSQHSWDGSSLPDSLAKIRRGRGPANRRVLIVLDQFEQWLRTWSGGPDDPLVLALRQCDGIKLQALIIVRDDFWSSTNRLLHLLEQPFAEGKSATNVSGFSPRHARRVLERLGRAHGAIAAAAAPSSGGRSAQARAAATASNDADSSAALDEAGRFIHAAVEQLTLDGNVLPVRLALFAEAVKELPWTLGTLRSIGGVDGAARYFLEAAFGPNAPAGQRRQRKAIAKLLAALLPDDPTVELKGPPQSVDSLREAAGLPAQTPETGEVLDLLETRLKLITAVEMDGSTVGDGSQQTAPVPQFQLTHDYLVRPLRAWIERDQVQTLRGRLQRRIDYLARAWEARREARNLPAWWQWPAYATAYWTSPREFRTKGRAAFMAAAHRRVALQAAVAGAALLGGAWALDRYRKETRAEELVATLRSAQDQSLPQVVASMTSLRARVNPRLRSVANAASLNPRDPEGARFQMRARLALLPNEPERVAEVVAALYAARPSEIAATRAILAPVAAPASVRLWEAERAAPDSDGRLRMACLLAGLDPAHERWKELGPEMVATVCRAPLLDARPWIELLLPARASMEGSLAATFKEHRDDPIGEVAAVFLADCLDQRPDALCDCVLSASDRQLRPVVDKLKLHRSAAIGRLWPECDRRSRSIHEAPRVAEGRAAGNAALALSALGDIRGLRHIARNAADPNARTRFFRGHAAADLPVEAMIAEVQASDATDDSRFVALMAIAGAARFGLKPSQAKALAPVLEELYRDRPIGIERRPGSDSGVHSIAGWLLEKLAGPEIVQRLDAEHQKQGVRAERDWLAAPEGHLMAIFRPQSIEQTIGVPHRQVLRLTHRVGYAFAVATKETTFEQIARLFPDAFASRRGAWTPKEPARSVDMSHMLGYPERINEELKLAEAHRIAPNWRDFYNQKRGLPLKRVDLAQMKGYRWPTDDEWEVACRAGSTSFWSFGDDGRDLDAFENHKRSAAFETTPVAAFLPNRAGLFDMQGNVMEYTMTMPWRRLSASPFASFWIRFRGGSYLSFANATGASQWFETEMPCKEGPVKESSGLRLARTL